MRKCDRCGLELREAIPPELVWACSKMPRFGDREGNERYAAKRQAWLTIFDELTDEDVAAVYEAVAEEIDMR